MMRRLLLLIPLWCLTLTAAAQTADVESLCRQIDKAIEESPQIVSRYEQQIEEVRLQYQHARQPEEKYQLAFRLYEQYKSFMNDSALYYLNEAEMQAVRQGKTAEAANCRALKAFQCSTVGYYNEALAFLKSIDKHTLDSVGLRNYYQIGRASCRERVYACV